MSERQSFPEGTGWLGVDSYIDFDPFTDDLPPRARPSSWCVMTSASAAGGNGSRVICYP